MRAAQEEQDDDTEVDMSPMIDMVFLLLIFFIVNAT
ncbi:MAG TPA: biopolymer transporter ExbD, partial [Verrucomicrobiales bacterium]|nr:biopolymer transporter ExbD [Verrucomicrobiales bacterium]